MKPRTLANAGWADPKTLPKGPNGRALCRYCGVEVPEGRRSFCSGERAVFVYRTGACRSEGWGCVHEHLVRSQSAYARKCVWARDLGKCATCPMVAAPAGHAWQADHIVPVIEGGGSCGLEGIRTLCTTCHRRETKALAARRAVRRAESRDSQVGDGVKLSSSAQLKKVGGSIEPR